MAHPLHNRFEESALRALREFYGDEIDEDVIEEVIGEHVDVDDPEHGRIYQMSGRVMDGKRKEPIRVKMTLPTGAAIGSSILSGMNSPDTLVVGAALLAIYGAVAQDRVSEIKPDLALTYAVGWELSNGGSDLVSRDELDERVLEESENHPEKVTMSKKGVEDALWELKDMGCISLKNIRGEKYIDFPEKSTLTYK
jgi:hypothetical protein